MKITLQNTTRLVEVNGVPARVWEGETESGIPVYALITRVAHHKDSDASQFEAELRKIEPASQRAIEAYDLRMFLP